MEKAEKEGGEPSRSASRGPEDAARGARPLEAATCGACLWVAVARKDDPQEAAACKDTLREAAAYEVAPQEIAAREDTTQAVVAAGEDAPQAADVCYGAKRREAPHDDPPMEKLFP